MAQPEQSESPVQPKDDSGAGAKKQQIDLQALADRVLKLLKEEAALEQERQGHHLFWKK